MLYRDGELYGKPGSAVAARLQWQSMAETTGHLLTGHALLRIPAGVITHTAGDTGSTTVHFGDPTEEELTGNVDSGEPLDLAGAFTLDGLGGWFIEQIEGNPSNVIGLSLPLMRRLFRSAGLFVVDLWQANS